MPLIVRDTPYDLPGSDGRTGPTGAEIDAIEMHFGVDYFDLMDMLTPPKKGAKPKPVVAGCTRNRAFYALAWMALHRQDDSVTLADVMAEYGRDELRFLADDPAPGEQAPDLPTPAGDEDTEPAATS
jgi:hypothetical protein